MPLSETFLTAETEALVRQADADRYLATLYAPQDKRAALLSLYAFNVEIASVRERVSQPLPGEIRLQWWRDVLESGSPEQAGGSPVATALLTTVRTHDLPVQPLLDMLEARIFDLYDDPMPSRTDLEGYCGETASALLQLSALVLDRDAARGAADAAGHGGCAQAIAGLLRSLPIHRARGQCYMPADLLNSVGVTPQAIVEGRDWEGIARAVAAMVALGRDHFAAFRSHARKLPSSLRPAFLPVALAGAYLDRLEADGTAAIDQIVNISPIRRQWIMLRHALRGW